MTKQNFIVQLAGLLMVDDVSKIKPESNLESIPAWDSMGKVAFLSMLDADLGVQPPVGALDNCKTVADLINLAETALTE
jgi:acyl carrier protein